MGVILIIETNSLVLWAKASNEDFSSIVEKAYSVLSVMKNFGDEFGPNYLTGHRRKNVNTFDLNHKTLGKVIASGINKERGTEFPTLGYEISFVSSLKVKEATRISMTVGVSNPIFVNNLVVDFSEQLDLFNNIELCDKITELFRNCCQAFNPYWGCVVNNVNMNRFESLYGRKLPSSIHWINYFGRDIVNLLGIEEIESAPAFSIEKLGLGYCIRMQKKSICDSNLEDIKKQATINNYFGLGN